MKAILPLVALFSQFPCKSYAFVTFQVPYQEGLHRQPETPSSLLYAVSKSQNAIFDGAEFISILSVLYQEKLEKLQTSMKAAQKVEVPPSRAGYITFVTGTPLNAKDGTDRIIGINCDAPIEDTDMECIQIDEDVFVQRDSIAEIPSSISDSDAISTATSALAGVRCSLPNKKSTLDENYKGKKVVVLGGGDFAGFTAKALDSLGAEVSLVTTRPMSLKDTPLNPLRNTNINAMAPATDDEMGFSQALGTFDAVVDTLGDEAKLERVRDSGTGAALVFGQAGLSAMLKRENKCNRYISTLTYSQRTVLKEGILFAREPVLMYQKEIEQTDISSDELLRFPTPSNYGQILERLMEANILFSTDRNENGSHQKKSSFVRGCSFPDYAEVEIWPTAVMDDAAVRYGFPGIGELTLEARVDELMGTDVPKQIVKEKKKQKNPFVMELDSLGDLREEIVEKEKNAVVFVSAPYCQLCRVISPVYTRMARISIEEEGNDLTFAKASSAGKTGKQMTAVLGIESVPTFLLFKAGEQYGEPFGATKLPSAILDAVIDNLLNDKDWDSTLINKDELSGRTKLNT